jgi:hypothetical protein
MEAKWLSMIALMGAVALAGACSSDEDDNGGSQIGNGGSGAAGGAAGAAGTGGSGAIGGFGATGGTGATGGSGGAGGGTCSDFFGDDADCKECLQTNCCAEVNACEADDVCANLVVCTRQCPEPNDGSSPCVQDCAADAGFSGSYNPLQICRSNHCTVECAHL